MTPMCASLLDMKCEEGQFLCPGGHKNRREQERAKCIPSTWKCDGVEDCSGGTDEETQLCRIVEIHGLSNGFLNGK